MNKLNVYNVEITNLYEFVTKVKTSLHPKTAELYVARLKEASFFIDMLIIQEIFLMHLL